MADNSPIEWLRGGDDQQGATWNIITGCSVISAGCRSCYAMRLAGTRMRKHRSRAGLTSNTNAGPVWNGEVRFNEEWLYQPLNWRRARMIFVCAHGDLFHEAVPDAWIDRVFAVMALAYWHTHLVLTKRARRMREYLNSPETINRIAREIETMRSESRSVGPLPHLRGGSPWWPLANVWLGVSVEDQDAADERIRDLLFTPAALRWISAEPLLGPVDLKHFLFYDAYRKVRGIDWCVSGGESGPKARPMNPSWPRKLRDDCAEAGVPFFFKQWGEWAPAPGMIGERAQILYSAASVKHTILDDGYSMARVGKKAAGRVLDGVIHDGYPGARLADT